MRATEGRLLTGRRSAGRMTGLGATTFFILEAPAFFALGAAAFLRAGFLAAAFLGLAGLPLPDPSLTSSWP
jgi:hypothetical protein